MTKIFIDFETRSAVDIKEVGAWAYAAHPSTDVLCLAYSIGNERAQGLLTQKELAAGKAFPIPDDAVFVAHNVHFEYAIWREIMVKHYGWKPLEDPRWWNCTLARAAAANLPLSLDGCGDALGITHKKDLHGRSVMLKLSRPIDFDPISLDPIYNEDPALYQKLYDYCARDVAAEMELDKRLPELSPAEKEVWNLDLLVNRRGVQMDVDLARAAAKMAATLTDQLNEDLVALTNGAVTKASRVAEMKRWIEARGVVVGESLDKASVTALLAREDVPGVVRKVLAIRRQVGKSSTAKYESVLNVASPADGRARGLLQYHAAGPGRWGGRLFQPQNLPKGLAAELQEAAIASIKDPQGIFPLEYGDQAMETLSGVVRGCIIAGEGKELGVADYSAIEYCVIVWLANVLWALADLRMGKKPYIPMAEAIYRKTGLSKEGTPKEYAVGKFTVLGAGYGMGWKRFIDQCAGYGVEITEELSKASIRAFREKYKGIVDLWYETESAARSAIQNPEKRFKCAGGRVTWGMDKKREFLCCALPSGRVIRYFRPSTKRIDTPYGEKDEIHYWAAGLNGSLEQFKTYGGSLVENICQAIARDIMAAGMLKAEAAGFPIVLTVHDELVAETNAGRKDSLSRLIALMCDVPKWGEGCPITAEGWVGRRYRK